MCMVLLSMLQSVTKYNVANKYTKIIQYKNTVLLNIII